jgi:hypothetical protein
MREIRTYGSEGGTGITRSFLPYPASSVHARAYLRADAQPRVRRRALRIGQSRFAPACLLGLRWSGTHLAGIAHQR